MEGEDVGPTHAMLCHGERRGSPGEAAAAAAAVVCYDVKAVM